MALEDVKHDGVLDAIGLRCIQGFAKRFARCDY
jgi:hypothetical protein